MSDGFGSMPLPATTAIVTMTSLLVVFALSRVLRNRWLWLVAACVPIAIVYCAYWMPVWIGANDPSQASAWETLFMLAWGGTATFACLILVAFVRMKKAGIR